MRHLDFITTMVSTFLGSINSTGYRKCPRVWNKKNAGQTVVLQRWRRSRASIGQKNPKNKTQANIVKEMSETFFLHIIYYWTILIQIITFPSSVFLIRVLFWKRDVERFVCLFVFLLHAPLVDLLRELAAMSGMAPSFVPWKVAQWRTKQRTKFTQNYRSGSLPTVSVVVDPRWWACWRADCDLFAASSSCYEEAVLK